MFLHENCLAGAAAEGLNSHSARARKEISKHGVDYKFAENIEKCFPQLVAGRPHGHTLHAL